MGTPIVPGQPDSSMDIYCENNISTSAGSKCYYVTDGPYGTTTSNNNLSSDATADDYGGTGHLINKSAGSQFVNTSTDFTLLSTADALNAGKTESTFTWDAIHVSGTVWRPQGATWDMGALELEEVTFQPRGTSLNNPYIY